MAISAIVLLAVVGGALLACRKIINGAFLKDGHQEA